MIRSITVTNYLGNSLKLDLAEPEKSGFVVLSIKGLGPGKADINNTEVATNDGSIFNSAKLPSRNIVLTLKYLWKDTIEESRQRSYKYFPIKKKVTLKIETDERTVETEGYVESNEPSIFSKDEGTDISIICPNPYFRSRGNDDKNVVVFSGIEAAFEFPFWNDSLVNNLLETGITTNDQEQVIPYYGDSETGIIITIHAIGAAENITIYNTGTREIMSINTDKIESITGSGIINGDDIIISTIKGSKSITLVRNANSTNILNCLDQNADWFCLARGDNIFAYTADSGATNLQFKIEYPIIYEGV